MKEYLAFFGSKQTVEQLCRAMICDDVNFLYAELKQFAAGSTKFIEKGALFDKWPYIAIVSTQKTEDEEDP